MNTRIKIIKRNRSAENERSQENRVVDSATTLPGKNKTRDMVSTVKSWIAELNDRKRLQPHSFSPLPVIAMSLHRQMPGQLEITAFSSKSPHIVRCSYD